MTVLLPQGLGLDLPSSPSGDDARGGDKTADGEKDAAGEATSEEGSPTVSAKGEDDLSYADGRRAGAGVGYLSTPGGGKGQERQGERRQSSSKAKRMSPVEASRVRSWRLWRYVARYHTECGVWTTPSPAQTTAK